LIVGELDYPVIEMNQDAMARMERAEVIDLKIIAGATHLFEEPGTMAEVERLAGEWFVRYLRG
jgi:putative phosphoribosyl transferase